MSLSALKVIFKLILSFSLARSPALAQKTPSADQKKSINKQLETVDFLKVESIFRECYIAHYIDNQIQKYLNDKKIPQEKFQKVRNLAYWDIIKLYSVWYAKNNLTNAEISYVLNILHSTEGKIFCSVVSKKYPKVVFKKAALGQKITLIKGAATAEQMSTISSITGFRGWYVLVVASFLNPDFSKQSVVDKKEILINIILEISNALLREGLDSLKIQNFIKALSDNKSKLYFKSNIDFNEKNPVNYIDIAVQKRINTK